MTKPKSPQWISVKDKLPEDEKEVLAYYGFGKECGVHFYGVLTYFAFDKTSLAAQQHRAACHPLDAAA